MSMKRGQTTSVTVGGCTFGARFPLVFIAGPCVIESRRGCVALARRLDGLARSLAVPYVFKASFDKANRTSGGAERGPGLERGLEQLAEIRRRLGVPVLTDIHESDQAERAACSVDVLQIPAFLCRQTDLVRAAARTGKPLNVKKAQFLAPEDMRSVLEKCREVGNDRVILCERGTSFGYRNLVVDFRSLSVLRGLGAPVMFDATHSVQAPGGLGGASGGDRRFVRTLARAALAVGVDALFLEVHPDPDRAMSDGPNMVPLRALPPLLEELVLLDDLVKGRLGHAGLEWVERFAAQGCRDGAPVPGETS